MITAQVESQDLQKALKDIDKYHDKAKQGISNEVSRAASLYCPQGKVGCSGRKGKRCRGKVEGQVYLLQIKRDLRLKL